MKQKNKEVIANSINPFQSDQNRINAFLAEILPPDSQKSDQLHAAMRYAVLNGGKRIRPLLVYATGKIFNVPLEVLDYLAAAVELVHCFSLVHDDLPAMDDDDLRRGLPTCHKAFDEATAILAGDALLCLAFNLLTEHFSTVITPNNQLLLIKTLSTASGSLGMTGGQALDLAAEGKNISAEELAVLHTHKTGALIRASVRLAALSANATAQQIALLDEFAKNIGLAFQIQDDILDEEETTENLGKRQGADLSHKKSTYPKIFGMAAAKKELQQLYQTALQQLDSFSTAADPLRLLAQYIIERRC